LNILSGGEKLDPRGQMEKSSKLKKRYVILGLIGSLIVRLIWITNKKTFIGFQDYWSKTADGNGVLVTFWHNQGLLMPLAWKGLRGRSRIIVSRSKDGDLIAGLLRIFGILCVRGSSTRGGKEALSDILIAGSDPGMTLVVTPDGPKGPAGIVKEGVSYLALKTGRPLYCLSVSYTRVHMFKSWDGFLLPWPLVGPSLCVVDPSFCPVESINLPERELVNKYNGILIVSTNTPELYLLVMLISGLLKKGCRRFVLSMNRWLFRGGRIFRILELLPRLIGGSG